MPPATFFARLGLFVRPGFLTPADSRAVMDTMRAAPREEALLTRGYDVVVDVEQRRTRRVLVPPEYRQDLRACFQALWPEVEAHFGVRLSTFQNLQFLIYEEGDFFQAHTDGSAHPEADDSLRRRQMSFVLFVNGQAPEPREDAFCGGALTFYDLIEGPEWAGKGFPLEAEAGLLVVFPSGVLHEVKPVTAGTRYTVVGWAE